MPGIGSYRGVDGSFFPDIVDALSGETSFLPTNVRTYAQGMLGRDSPITGQDFSGPELDVVGTLARNAYDPQIVPEGPQFINLDGSAAPRSQVSYSDYDSLPKGMFSQETDQSYFGPPISRFLEGRAMNAYDEFAGTDAATSVRGTLGNFSAEPGVDGYNIRDTYDFHERWDNGEPALRQIKDVVTGDRDPMSVLETMAVRYGPTPVSGGIPVDFTIPYDPLSEIDMMNRKRAIAAYLRR